MKMQTIVIPGYSTKNKEWADETVKKIGGQAWNFSHWTNPNDKFNPQKEATRILENIGDEPTNFIAKSIGTLVLVHILNKNIKVANKVILCGVPINDMNENDLSFYKVLSDFDPTKIIVIQNSTDEHGSFEQVRKFVNEINPQIKIIEKPGSTHNYPYDEDFIGFLD